MAQDLSQMRALLAKRRAEMQAEEEANRPPAVDSSAPLPVGLEDFEGDEERHWDPDPFIAHVKGMSPAAAISKLTIKDPKPTKFSQRDGIKFRCPHHDHTDNDPSAWINSKTHEWYCGGCENGGDWLELAAATFGYRLSTGWSDRKNQWPIFLDDLKTFLSWSEPDPEPYVVPAEPSEPKKSASESVSGDPEDTSGGAFFNPTASGATKNCQFNWHEIIPENTFLRLWMEETSKDDSPEEFHFAHGLLALGLATGRDVALLDTPRVLGNLYVCIIGESGTGKSKATRHLKNLLSIAMPFDAGDATNNGVSLISSPASGEVLYKEFSRPIMDPADARKIAYYGSVKGLIDYPELSGLTGRASRLASTMKPTLIELYDSPKTFATTSLTRGRVYAEDPYGSMVTTVQPGTLSTLVTSNDDRSGFLNRFMFVSGTRKPPFAINLTHVDVILPAAMLREIQTWAEEEFTDNKPVTWSPDASALWSGFFTSTIVPAKENSGNDMLGRLDLLMKKLILLFSANVMSNEVQVREVQAAIDLFPYLTQMYVFTTSQIERQVEHESEDAVLVALNKIMKERSVSGKVEVEDWPTVRDITHKMSVKPKATELRKTLEDLVFLGHVERRAWKPKIGRPTEKYCPVNYL